MFQKTLKACIILAMIITQIAKFGRKEDGVSKASSSGCIVGAVASRVTAPTHVLTAEI
jgi:hypothetical protein